VKTRTVAGIKKEQCYRSALFCQTNANPDPGQTLKSQQQKN